MSKSPESILAIDCGTTFTKAVFIEKTETRFRVRADAVALSTQCAPWHDIALGVHDAVRDIEDRIGTAILSTDGRHVIGADTVAMASSAGDPLRVILAGVTRDGSLQISRRAIASIFALPVAEFALDDTGDARRAQTRIATIHQTPADVLLMVGGTDGGISEPVLDLAQVMAMALQTLPVARRPAVIFAGNKTLRPHMAGIFGRITDYKPVDNILPALGVEQFEALQAELSILHRQKKDFLANGGPSLLPWLQTPVISAATAFAGTVKFLGKTHGVRILGAAVGARSATLVMYGNDAGHTAIIPDGGIAVKKSTAAVTTIAEQMQLWLPFEITPEQLRIILHNRTIYPHVQPATKIEKTIAAATLRWSLQNLRTLTPVSQLPPMPDVVLMAGQPFSTPNDKGLTLLALLNGLQPAGIFSVMGEKHHLLSMLGAIAAVDPLAAADLAAYDALETVATVIAPFGDGRTGETALKFTVTLPDGTVSKGKIRAGMIHHLPETAGKICEINVRPGKNFSLYGAETGNGRAVAATVDGGALGIIFDMRGRPVLPVRCVHEHLADMTALGINTDFEGEELPFAASNATD